MAQGDVKVQCPLTEGLWEIAAVLGAIETTRNESVQAIHTESFSQDVLLVIQLEAHTQNRIAGFILPLSNVEQSLAEVTAKIEAHSYIE